MLSVFARSLWPAIALCLFSLAFLTLVRHRRGSTGTSERPPGTVSGQLEASSHDQRGLGEKAVGGDYASTENCPPEFRGDNLQLYVRMNFAKGWNESRSCLFPSLQLFWPHPRIVVALDGGSPADEREAPKVARFVASNYPPLKASGLVVPNHPELAGAVGYGGWQRGQLDMMLADKVVHAKYVGLLDSDALIVTVVTPRAIFSKDSRPIVLATVGRAASPGQEFWQVIPRGVEFVLKKLSVISCMSSFPVVFATEDIAAMRAYVEKIHRRPFLLVYRELVSTFRYYCHFTIMCNFMWYFRRDKYDFHFQNFAHNRGDWQRRQAGASSNFSFLTAENTKPIVRISTHFSYTSFGIPFDLPDGAIMVKRGWMKHLRDKYDLERIRPILINSFCHSAQAQCRSPDDCELLTKACLKIDAGADKLQNLLFRFETTQTWEWDPGVLQAQRDYYNIVKNYRYWLSYGRRILDSYHQSSYTRLTAQT